MKEEQFRIIEPGNGFDVAVDEFPHSLVGKVMHSIHFLSGVSCPTKEKYLEALQAFSEDIINDVKNNNF